LPVFCFLLSLLISGPLVELINHLFFRGYRWPHRPTPGITSFCRLSPRTLVVANFLVEFLKSFFDRHLPYYFALVRGEENPHVGAVHSPILFLFPWSVPASAAHWLRYSVNEIVSSSIFFFSGSPPFSLFSCLFFSNDLLFSTSDFDPKK